MFNRSLKDSDFVQSARDTEGAHELSHEQKEQYKVMA